MAFAVAHERGFVTQLLTLMNGGDVVMEQWAAQCLLALAQHAVNQVFIASAEGVIVHLVRTLESTDEIKRQCAKTLLGILSQNPACAGLL